MGDVRGRSGIVPTLRYRDVEGAQAWLCAAFGFVPHTLVRNAEGRVASAQLVYGAGMIILAPVGDSEFDELMRQPDEIGGAETQSCYFVVADGDAHYATAKAAGADIILDLQNFEHGGRGYLCRDPEGHLWSFGTFDPWAGDDRAAPSARSMASLFAGSAPRALVAAAAGALLVPAAIALAWSWRGPQDVVSRAALQTEQSARATAERRASEAEEKLTRLAENKDDGELETAKMQEELAHLAEARERVETERRASEATVRKLAEQISQLQLAKTASERTMRQLTARSLRDRQLHGRSRRQVANLNATIAAQHDAAQRAAAALREAEQRLDKAITARKAAEAHQANIEQLLAEEREAKAQAETGLQQVSEQLKQEQAARRAAELAQQEGQVPAPRPAVRPDR